MTNNISQNFKPSELLNQMDLDLNRVKVEPDSSSNLYYEFEINANEFIKYAELDLQQGTVHGLVNALSNAKRAIDCQIDTILGCFGLLSRQNYPQKIEFLRGLGILTPRIVNKVVKARNYLEHEFKKPELEQVEDAVDIANLFISSIRQASHFFNTDFVINTIVDGVLDKGHPFADKILFIHFDEKEKQFVLSGVVVEEPPTPEARRTYRIERAIIHPREKGFMELIKLALNIDKSLSEKELSLHAIQFIQLFGK
jgi:hypothetical protein